MAAALTLVAAVGVAGWRGGVANPHGEPKPPPVMDEGAPSAAAPVHRARRAARRMPSDVAARASHPAPAFGGEDEPAERRPPQRPGRADLGVPRMVERPADAVDGDGDPAPAASEAARDRHDHSRPPIVPPSGQWLAWTPGEPTLGTWAALVQCESNWNPRAISKNGLYHGLFQFDARTWAWVGMTGDPIEHTAEQQLLAARRLWRLRGFLPWPTCGRRLGLIQD